MLLKYCPISSQNVCAKFSYREQGPRTYYRELLLLKVEASIAVKIKKRKKKEEKKHFLKLKTPKNKTA